MMYKSQFKKIDPYDWFCGPGLHMLVDFDVRRQKGINFSLEEVLLWIIYFGQKQRFNVKFTTSQDIN